MARPAPRDGSATNRASSRGRKFVRAIAYTLFAGIWLLLLLVALELFARFSFTRETQTNPYIRGTLDGTFEGPDAGLRPFNGNLAPLPLEIVESNARALARAGGVVERSSSDPVWTLARVHESRETTATRRQAFPALSEDDRQRFAILHAELIVEWDSNGGITAMYGGNSLTETVGHVLDPDLQWFWRTVRMLTGLDTRAELHGVAPGAQTAWGELAIRVQGDDPEEGLAFTTDMFVLSGPGEERYGFLAWEDFLSALMRSLVPVESESPWDIPYFRFKPNEVFEHNGQVIETNEHGLRNRPVVTPKPPGIVRVLCIGGSTTEEGETNDTSWPGYLEHSLREEFGDGVEVINAGIRGMRLADHMAKLPLYASYEPDIVLVYDGINDVLFNHFVLSPRMLARLVCSNSVFLRRYVPASFRTTETELDRSIEAIALPNLEMLAHWAQAEGVALALASFDLPDPTVCTAEEIAYLDFNIDQNWHPNYGVPFHDVHAAIARYNEGIRRLTVEQGLFYIPYDESCAYCLDRYYDLCHRSFTRIHEQGYLLANALVPLVEARFAAQAAGLAASGEQQTTN